MNEIIYADNLEAMKHIQDKSIDLIYIDPPFNIGKRQQYIRIKTTRSTVGDRVGFGAHRYTTTALTTTGFDDKFTDYYEFLLPRLHEAYRVLKSTGSFFFHIDPREVHYCKVILDGIFGRDSFMNEIIWAYDFGGRAKRKWSAKHNNILWYVVDPKNYTFNFDAMDRIPYMAPGLVGAEKAARGKTPTDVWWHTIVPTNGAERVGYATQKPLGVLRRIVNVHTNPGDTCLDFFAGSGTLGEAAALAGCNFILIDNNHVAAEIMRTRLAQYL